MKICNETKKIIWNREKVINIPNAIHLKKQYYNILSVVNVNIINLIKQPADLIKNPSEQQQACCSFFLAPIIYRQDLFSVIMDVAYLKTKFSLSLFLFHFFQE